MTRSLLIAFALLIGAVPSAAARMTEILAADAIEDRITQELGTQTRLGAGAKLELDNKSVQVEAAGKLAVENLTYEPRSGRVSALIVSETDDGGTERVRVTGSLRYMVALPVLNRYVAPGETIRAGDIDRVTVRSDRIYQAVVAEADELVGRTPRRAIRPQEPVRQADIMMPIVVKKGDLVTVVLETSGLRLTVQAKSNDDGAQGATIHVANTKSGRVLDAIVTGPGMASIPDPSAALR
jgi:flagellar basal body P-ring formation protein FlgA